MPEAATPPPASPGKTGPPAGATSGKTDRDQRCAAAAGFFLILEIRRAARVVVRAWRGSSLPEMTMKRGAADRPSLFKPASPGRRTAPATVVLLGSNKRLRCDFVRRAERNAEQGRRFRGLRQDPANRQESRPRASPAKAWVGWTSGTDLDAEVLNGMSAYGARCYLLPMHAWGIEASGSPGHRRPDSISHRQNDRQQVRGVSKDFSRPWKAAEGD